MKFPSIGFVIPILVLSLFVLIVKPLTVLVIMGLMGYRKQTSFRTAVTLAQISEFSLILMAMGVTLGHVKADVASLVIIVGVVTMTLSTYLIHGLPNIYTRLKALLVLFEKSKKPEPIMPFTGSTEPKSGHIVLVGSHRTGGALIGLLTKRKEDFVVVDFNPDLASSLVRKRVPVVFGDISDEEVLKAASVAHARLVISTTSNLQDNLALLSYIKGQTPVPLSVIKAATSVDALMLYKNGATYVIVPEVVAGEHIRHILKNYGISGKRIKAMGKNHAKRLSKNLI
jgi:hypothetical protein